MLMVMCCSHRQGKFLWKPAPTSIMTLRCGGAPDNAILRKAYDANGHRLKMKSVLPPRSGYGSSYLNVYVANGAVIGTCFGDSERDETAAQILTEAFPGREIVMLRTDNLVAGGGGIHCLTQPMPLETEKDAA